ncbi:MAG: hypothetical protein LBB74_01300 [Chitinispirillales bacterium]|jgi:hypothetical protein|nr:hypothetical protein [Chitinispirillales bacterium]
MFASTVSTRLLARAVITITLFTVFTAALAGPRDPFPFGCSMASQGAIADPEGATGREPWVSAALYRDTLRYGVSGAAVSYHGGGSVSQYAVGGFGVVGPIVGKILIAHLDALGIYYEQTAGLSLGGCRKYLSYSVDTRLYSLGLYGDSEAPRVSLSAGAAVCLRTRLVIVDAAVSGVTLMSAGAEEADAPLSVAIRLCTVRNRYGTQGAAAKITPSDRSPLRFVIAQEYRIGAMFAVSASIASNPTMIGFGITVDKPPVSGGAAVVNHPELGWSSGVSADWRPHN